MATAPRGNAEGWTPLPLDKGLFSNLDPDAVLQYSTALENGFVNELGGITRFPGLEPFCTLNDNGRVYFSDFQGDLIAATSKGRVYRIARNGKVTDCTGVQVSGGRRVIITPTDRDVLFAAGGPIVRLRKNVTEILSTNAPSSTHVGWIDGYTIAVQVNSQNAFYDDGSNTWDPENVIQANSNPDNINSLLIDPFRELLFGGTNKIEQWERLTSGNVPFFRRWAIGDGMRFPYASVFANNAVWTLNSQYELVQFLAQISKNSGNEIGALLESIDNWTDVWMGGYPNKPLHTIGQKFILLQAPNATNEYGTRGITLCHDYRSHKFFSLYGWDNQKGVPTRWPGWSHWPLWGEVFVGGEGQIFKLTTDTYTNNGTLQRWLVRTSHIAEGNMLQVKDFRLRLKRGLGNPNSPPPTIRVRCRRDAKSFGPWISRDLGVAGDNLQFKNYGGFGTATTFQWEIMCADNVPIDLVGAEIKTMNIGH